MSSYWRHCAREAIGAVVKEWQAAGQPDDLAHRLRAAYPFGERSHYPYQVWLEEQRATLVLFGFIPAPIQRHRPGKPIEPLPGQTALWEDSPQ